MEFFYWSLKASVSPNRFFFFLHDVRNVPILYSLRASQKHLEVRMRVSLQYLATWYTFVFDVRLHTRVNDKGTASPILHFIDWRESFHGNNLY